MDDGIFFYCNRLNKSYDNYLSLVATLLIFLTDKSYELNIFKLVFEAVVADLQANNE